MATYPTFRQYEGSDRTPRGGIMVRTATSGKSRARALSSAIRRDPVLVHNALTQAEMDELVAFHEANRGEVFDVGIVADGSTMSCLFRDPPWSEHPYQTGEGRRYRVQVNLVQAD